MQLNSTRRLSEAVGSWLHLEFMCFRGGLMSEASLKFAVGQVLSTFPSTDGGARVHGEVKHAALGTKLRVDFALCSKPKAGPCTSVEFAVETKWAGSSHCKPEKIGEDFLRLAAIKKADPKARCIFLLAGQCRDVEATLSSIPFDHKGVKADGIQLIASPAKLLLDPLTPWQISTFAKAVKKLDANGAVMPQRMSTICHGLHPVQTAQKTVRFQSIAWEIESVSARPLGNLNVW